MENEYVHSSEVDHDLYKEGKGDDEKMAYVIGKRMAARMNGVVTSYLERLVDYVSRGYEGKRFSPAY
ncbi:hypothetical protein HYT24_02645 [Candidatus Pacearchaeota archaeon]|nr:hypothetical protein [Candidatus Pacearchaeota archaeon]